MTVIRIKFTRKTLFFGALLIMILAALFYLFLIREVKESTTQQLLIQKQRLAKAEASNVQTFFELFGGSISLLAQTDSLEGSDLNSFLEQWQDTGYVAGIILTDSRGIVTKNSNILGTDDVGTSLASRYSFIRAKNQRQNKIYIVGEPVEGLLGASKGQTIIPVAAPVFRNGVFAGMVAASVQLDPMTKHYFEMMKVIEQTEIYLVDSDGSLLYSSLAAGKLGENISQIFGDEVKTQLGENQEGTVQTGEYIIAFSPIALGEQNWQLMIVLPNEKLNEIMAPIYIRQLSLFLLVLFTVLLFGVVAGRQQHKR